MKMLCGVGVSAVLVPCVICLVVYATTSTLNDHDENADTAGDADVLDQLRGYVATLEAILESEIAEMRRGN